MARRDMLRHTVWLSALDTDRAEGREVAPQPMDGTTNDQLLRSINRCGYMVELWLDGEATRARCYPVRRQIDSGRPPLSYSYSAPSIRLALLAALQDIDLVGLGNVAYRFATREHIRWVR